MRKYIVLLGVAIQFFGIIIYIKKIIKWEWKPNKVTWLMRSLAPIIASVAAFFDWIRRAALPVFMSGFWPLLVFTASFFSSKAYRKIESFDYICGVISFLGLLWWRITKEPLIAIIFAIISDGFAAVPTIIKSRQHPQTESTSAYITGLISVITWFFAMKTYAITEIAFPIYIIILNTSIIVILLRKRIAQRWKKFKIQHL